MQESHWPGRDGGGGRCPVGVSGVKGAFNCRLWEGGWSNQIPLFFKRSQKSRMLGLCSVGKSCRTLWLPNLSLSPGVCSNPCALSWWCHPTISSSVAPSPPSLNLSKHQGLFQWVSSSHQVAKILGLQLQHQSFQWKFRVDFLSDWLVWTLCCPRDSQESSLVPPFESINSLALSLLYGPTLTSVHDYLKNYSFD